MNYDEIPYQFYEETWEDADHPMACVNLNNEFMRVNHAFEKLLGYSSAEVEGRTWMEFTEQKHVGGDLSSVEAVKSGKLDSYSLEKDYIHKRGFKVPVRLIVRRYPKNSIEDLLFFRVETPIVTATQSQLQDVARVNEHTLELLDTLKERLRKVEERGFVQVGDSWRDGDKTGRDKNSLYPLKVMGGAIIFLATVIMWMAYYMASIANNVPPVPPSATGG